MSGRKVLYAALGILLVVLFFFTQFRIQPDERPVGEVESILELARRDDLNIVFVLVDTLRADRLASYGYERPTSPTMDRLASAGIRFSRHYSQSSWTKTSMASIWTGMYPHRNGILRFDHALPGAALLPAEILREEGFSTAAIWRNGWVAPTFGFDQGFETYHRPSTGMQMGFKRRESKNPYAKIAGSDVDVTENAIEFLRLTDDSPFMLYLHYMDAHQYMSDETSALFGSSYSDLYDNSIHWTDRNIAALINTLEEEGLRDKTIVVITSDHGEAFGEHGAEGHAKDLHAEVIRVPWILSLPFSLDEGIVVDSLSENVDIWPTLFDLLGAPELEYADGRSRLPDILMSAGRPDLIERAPDARPLFAELDRAWGKAEKRADPIVALTLPEKRYMRVLDPEAIRQTAGPRGPGRGTSLLYDIREDPVEQNDLLEGDGNDEQAAKFDAIVDEILARPPPPWRDEVGKVELSDMQKGQLRAIGYAIE
jgi:arylsulfatase A-like enzyme